MTHIYRKMTLATSQHTFLSAMTHMYRDMTHTYRDMTHIYRDMDLVFLQRTALSTLFLNMGAAVFSRFSQIIRALSNKNHIFHILKTLSQKHPCTSGSLLAVATPCSDAK